MGRSGGTEIERWLRGAKAEVVHERDGDSIVENERVFASLREWIRRCRNHGRWQNGGSRSRTGWQELSDGRQRDEDINTLATIIPSIEILDPITRS
jgi:hypothetical protein